MNYICICGKEFDNPQAFNGHKTHCRIHQLNKYGSLEKMISSNAKAAKTGRAGLTLKLKNKKEEEERKWIEEQHICECCGKIMTAKFGSGRFCSRSCANVREQSDEINTKRSKTIKAKANLLSEDDKRANYYKHPKICSDCGGIIEFERRNLKICKQCGQIRQHLRNVKAGKSSANSQREIRRSKNEIYFCELCENYFNNVKHNEPMFNGWDADVIIEDIKYAVLWNGKWHYEEISKKQSLKQVQTRDKIKLDQIKLCGYTPYIIKDLGKYNKEFVEEQFNLFLEHLAGGRSVSD